MEQLDLTKLPEGPGVYLFKDQNEKVIYVGKAKNIRKRVSQYFYSKQDSPKTKVLVSKIKKIDFFCTHSEKEALLLEYNLIKKYRPKYNIVLKDDKSYLLFKIDLNHEYPRIEITRKTQYKSNCKYFGPYTSAKAARETYKILNTIFPLRKCKETVFKNRTRPCLQFHIKRCLGPCCTEVNREEYMELIKEVELFLKGNSDVLIKKLEKEMWIAADKLEFEKAALIRDKIKKIRYTLKKQRVIIPKNIDMDVFSLDKKEDLIGVGILLIRNGRLIDQKKFIFRGEKIEFQLCFHNEQEVYIDILQSVMYQLYSLSSMIPDKILLPFKLENMEIKEFLKEKKGKNVALLSPTTNEHKDLLRLASLNIFKEEPASHLKELIKLSEILKLTNIPKRIEVIDASHIGGEYPMVGLVVMEEGELKKNEYRIYHLKELGTTRDDYLILRTWAKKRVSSGPPWPDLLIIDGGKGQLHVVEKSFLEELKDIPFKIISIAKGKNNEEDRVYISHRKNPLPLKPGSKELLLIKFLRDNVHRFVLSKTTVAAKNSLITSEIEKIKGIGKKRAKLLWDEFKSLDKLLSASAHELKNVKGIGEKRAEELFLHLQKLKEQFKSLKN